MVDNFIDKIESIEGQETNESDILDYLKDNLENILRDEKIG